MDLFDDIDVNSEVYQKYDSSLETDTASRDAFLDSITTEPSYQYDALTNDSFRLIRLLPGTGYEPILCEMFLEKFCDATHFEALSYCWGDPEPPATILIGKSSVSVTRSLKLALAYLRLKESARILWVDALCINQNDNSEKSVQLGQAGIQDYGALSELFSPIVKEPGGEVNLRAFNMCKRIRRLRGDIKAGLTTALQYVQVKEGESRDQKWARRAEKLAIKTHNSLFTVMRSKLFACSTTEQNAIYNEARQVTYEKEDDDGLESEGISKDYGPGMAIREISREERSPGLEDTCMLSELCSLRDLLERRWFRRVWVLQEVAVAKKVVIQCGPATMDWRTLAITGLVLHYSTMLTKSNLILNAAEVNLSNLLEISILRGMIQRQQNGNASPELNRALNIGMLVKRYRKWQASDPRDKVYALLGLTSERLVNFDIDYDCSVEKTYTNVVIASLQQYRNLNLVSCATKPTKEIKLPAWASSGKISADIVKAWRGQQTSLAHAKSPARINLPSWIPDWRDPIPPFDLIFSSFELACKGLRTYTGKSFAASGQMGKAATSFQLAKDGTSLAVSGQHLDTVTELGDVLNTLRTISDGLATDFNKGKTSSEQSDFRSEVLLFDFLHLSETLHDWMTRARVLDTTFVYRTQESMETVFRRLLNLDLQVGAYSERAVEAEFRKWLARLEMVIDAIRGGMTLDNALFADEDNSDTEEQSHVSKMYEHIVDDCYRGNGGTSAAFRRAYGKGHLTPTSAMTRAAFKVAKFASWAILKAGNFSLVFSNPLACTLRYLYQRRPAWGNNGFLALVPGTTGLNDKICLLEGSAVPFVIRQRADKWEIVGSAYVHGAMYGEMWDPEQVVRLEFL